jgi:radical SAM protein (TIGR04043 family)
MIKLIITDLQSLGLRGIPLNPNRKGGAGPAEGIAIAIDNIPVNVPTNAHYVSRSPYVLKASRGRNFLFKDETELLPVDVISEPKFYDITAKDGIKLKKIALLHGKNCLATTVIQTCVYWNTAYRCKFCGIELSLKNGQTLALKTPEQLAEAAKIAKASDDVRHIVLTSGSVRPSLKGIRYISDCIRSIKKAVDLPIHVQVEPPEDPEELEEFKDAGLDTIGLHIESFDVDILSKIAPVKAAFGIKRYEKAWKKSVELFGSNQVSTFLIAGLGERRKSIINGSKYLAGMGVYPFLVPFRPIPGTVLGKKMPPGSDLMVSLYETVARILEKNDISSEKSKAGCVRCGACSAIAGFER